MQDYSTWVFRKFNELSPPIPNVYGSSGVAVNKSSVRAHKATGRLEPWSSSVPAETKATLY